MTPDYKAALEKLNEVGSAGFIFEVGEDVLRLALTEAAGKQWQDIETAPRDGTEILIYVPDAEPKIVCGRWVEDSETEEVWFQYSEELLSDAFGVIEDPTHWMPLPASPTASSEGE